MFYIASTAIAAVAIAKQMAGLWGIALGVSSAAGFWAAYGLFDRFVWKWTWLQNVFGIPDLSGRWDITGHTSGADGVERHWFGTATIKQTWSHISISISTEFSRSRSSIASLESDPGHGYRLVYCYSNEPKENKGDLKTHKGTCEVIFADDLSSATALYFNDHQRGTTGTMAWKSHSQEGE